MRSRSRALLDPDTRERLLPTGEDARDLDAVSDAMRDDMLLLHQSIEAKLHDVPQRVVQFTAARRQEGTSTIVRAYARVLACTVRQSVAIIDANAMNPEQRMHFGIDTAVGWDDAIVRGEPIQRAICGTSDPNLSVVPFSPRPSGPSIFDAPTVEQIFAHLRGRFDTVLIDSGPVSQPGSLAMSRVADGVVLVVHAEKTRWPVARKAAESLERGGATVLGVVLNRRRFHIPPSIYRWL